MLYYNQIPVFNGNIVIGRKETILFVEVNKTDYLKN